MDQESEFQSYLFREGREPLSPWLIYPILGFVFIGPLFPLALLLSLPFARLGCGQPASFRAGFVLSLVIMGWITRVLVRQFQDKRRQHFGVALRPFPERIHISNDSIVLGRRLIFWQPVGRGTLWRALMGEPFYLRGHSYMTESALTMVPKPFLAMAGEMECNIRFDDIHAFIYIEDSNEYVNQLLILTKFGLALVKLYFPREATVRLLNQLKSRRPFYRIKTVRHQSIVMSKLLRFEYQGEQPNLKDLYEQSTGTSI